mmetsp:Transcript_6759/g.18121  ORF Transcript_6759/g.18121 Transcript_6759/m.18121 type:complete len:518 (-) Transcript_6759:597-2150(-)
MQLLHNAGLRSAAPRLSTSEQVWTPARVLTICSRNKVIARGERRSANRTLNWPANQVAAQEDEPTSEDESALSSVTDSNAVLSPALSSLNPASQLVWEAAEHLQDTHIFSAIDRLVAHNLRKVQAAFREHRVGPQHFQGSTGYGHGDWGRETLDNVMAQIMGAEAALVRIQFMSGTHAIAAGLYAALRPGEEMLAVAGHPYDTMEEVIGTRGTPGRGSLMEWGVSYRELDLKDGKIDWEALRTAIIPGKTRVAHIQRSCGYALRNTLTIAEIKRAIDIIRSQDPTVVVTVDNCYGEFTEELEPCAVGADLCMGSLIKNPGGTIAPGGAYVAGTAGMVEAVGARLAAPGIGLDAGSVPGTTLHTLFQGLFLAPQTTGEALKGGRLVAEVMHREGYNVMPAPGLPEPHSMITAIELGSKQHMVAFCQAIQKMCPVGSYIRPEPGVTAGYGDPVIFADGTFIDGSTAELSADGPIRPPFVVYCQGGTHWTHWAIALEPTVEALREENRKLMVSSTGSMSE